MLAPLTAPALHGIYLSNLQSVTLFHCLSPTALHGNDGISPGLVSTSKASHFSTVFPLPALQSAAAAASALERRCALATQLEKTDY